MFDEEGNENKKMSEQIMNVFCVKEKLPEIRLEEDIYPATPPLSIWLANVTSSDHTCDISTKREREREKQSEMNTNTFHL